MSTCELIDTFPSFLDYWSGFRHMPLDKQIEAWKREYMSGWPELLEKQIEDYREQNLDWGQIALENVFPSLDERIPAMQEAWKNLVEQCKPVHSKVQEKLQFESNTRFVIYVGLLIIFNSGKNNE